ncbi:hypothetical protein BOO86_02725 [Mycobacterium sp. CBMA 234]|uniref:helix-turn-helix transcriptional regulator n=1 Tax=Mycolicibacterium sp. CBMA 234 TaxID=1918495 RepID=UPI0012DEEB12|nr:helix-turn-helix transcriptional regulator [Mycolicibacterium sp. CBMA 234]MUL63368.1 hypothetical protein [Mycolicibacterium sp. CBMA 234]
MANSVERLWFEPQQCRPTHAEIDAAGNAFRRAHGLDDEDDDWSFDGKPPQPDPVAADVFGGISRRALTQARDNGWTWAEIGRILGVSRQVLHKRFRNRPPD